MMPQTDPTPIYSALVLDDNFFNRDLFRIALENAGYTVTEVEDPIVGNEMLKEQTFSLMVLDLQMPKLDGATILRSIRNLPIHSKMHIIVVTAESQRATDDVDEMADFMMIKPINVMEFSALAKRLQSVQSMRAQV